MCERVGMAVGGRSDDHNLESKEVKCNLRENEELGEAKLVSCAK